jgi:hypothetical protein
MSRKHRTRRRRRQARAARNFGIAAAPRHKGRSGRTGGMHERKTRPARAERYIPVPARSIAAAARCIACGAGPGEVHDHGRIGRT